MELVGRRHGMNIIEVRPSKKLKGAWAAFEASGVEPAFAAPDAKQKAIDYAYGRFGGGAGEVHIFGDDASTIERTIVMDGRGQYPQIGCD
jgi:hypothetical protein